MACLLAGTTHAPLTATMMVFEMTLDYHVVVPLLLGSTIASLAASRLSRESVYTEALRRNAAAQEGAPSKTLEAMRVADLMRAEQVTVLAGCPAPALLETFVRVRRNHLYVVDEGGRFLGAVNLHDLNAALRDEAHPERLTALGAMRARFEFLLPDDAIGSALEKFERQECERLPVVEDLTSKRLVGTISKRDILSAYARERLAASAARRE
jgi:CIC family chloride channel protein